MNGCREFHCLNFLPCTAFSQIAGALLQVTNQERELQVTSYMSFMPQNQSSSAFWRTSTCLARKNGLGPGVIISLILDSVTSCVEGLHARLKSYLQVSTGYLFDVLNNIKGQQDHVSLPFVWEQWLCFPLWVLLIPIAL